MKSEGGGEKGTLEGRRVVYDVSLLMDYLFSATATERDGKVTRNIKRRRALAFPEFYTGPAALIHDCPACTRPSVLCAAPRGVEYAICMIIVIIITSS